MHTDLSFRSFPNFSIHEYAWEDLLDLIVTKKLARTYEDFGNLRLDHGRWDDGACLSIP